MISGKELTLEDILKEMHKLKYRLLVLKEKLGLGKIEIKAVTYKDVKTKTSFKGDIMLNRLIKADGTREEYDAVKESYEAHRQLLAHKIGEMIENKPIEECIIYLRDNLRWKWKDIAEMFNYSVRQCHNLYDKGKNK